MRYLKIGAAFNAARLAHGTILILSLPLLGACGWLGNAPESRARDFIEALVLNPADTAALRDRANLEADADPLALAADLSCQVALQFLRAQRQIDTLHFVIGEENWPNAQRKSIAIHVRGSKDKTHNIATFIVDLEKQKEKGWRIVKVHGA